ncbi:MAG TPA: N-acetylglucosamine-6-phosphate deacetylase [Candidatus Cryosericum sp.]|nr:N-acetylglucosamine-6-phosphate deacetylase [Candidatus Cryosericum sp.]
MRYENAMVYGPDFRFHKGGFSVENGRFRDVLVSGAEQADDLENAFVIPGLIDIHNHGNSGHDFSDGDAKGLETIARYLAGNGVTSFAPASMTLPEEQLAKAYRSAVAFVKRAPGGCSVLRGIHMEGPFFSEKKKGAQNGAYLKNPDIEMFTRLNKEADGLIRIADVAPELPGAIDFIRQISQTCTVSIAHSDANYEQAKAAIAAGASHVTHLFNGMPPFLHRAPGIVGAAAESQSVRAELICDGIHVHESVVRAAFSMFGTERICLISDALACCGMPNGEYTLGGQKIFLDGTVARLVDAPDTLAGSANNLFGIFRLALSFGIPAEAAVRMASFKPACAIGAEHEVGSIENGKRADFLVLGGDFSLRRVFLGGAELRRN